MQHSKALLITKAQFIKIAESYIGTVADGLYYVVP